MTDDRRTLERIGDRVPVPEPALERLLHRRDRSRRNDRITGLVVSLLVIVLAATAVLVGSSRSTPAGTGPAPSPTTPPGPISRELLSGIDRPLAPGPYWLSRGELFVSFTVPAGWRSFGNLAVSGPDRTAVGFWFVDRVPVDPCGWKGEWLDPGTSVDGLADALSGQPGTSEPVDVTLGGNPGRMMRLEAPTAGVDFKDCDETTVHKRSYEHVYVRWWMGDSWFGQKQEQIDRIWILDVHGERLVVAASWLPSTPQRSRSQIDGIVDSISIT